MLPVARAESIGDAGQITREVDLRVKPSESSKSLGRLPKGTIVTQKGERKDRFYRIEVELEDGVVEGWVPEDALTESSKGAGAASKPEEPEKREKEEPREMVRPSNKLRVPRDEGLLLRRDQSFLYGVHIAPEFDIMSTDVDSDTYLGWGFTAGGHLGLFLAQNMSVHIELNYANVQGVGRATSQVLVFGFFETNAQLRYMIERFEFVGGIQYSLGISLNDVPTSLGLTGARDMSSLYFVGAVGYRLPLTEVLNMSIRARYAVSFLRAPVFIQRIGAFLYLEFGG